MFMSSLCHAVQKNNKLGALYTNAILLTVNHIIFYTDQVVSVVENSQLKSACGNVLLGYRIALTHFADDIFKCIFENENE